MSLEKIIKNIDAYDQFFKERYPDMKAYEYLTAQMLKLTEEVGELSEAILHMGGYQRADKTDIDFNNEVADVIICALLIAKIENINIWDVLEQKLLKNNERFNINI